MQQVKYLFILGLAVGLAGCFESLPKSQDLSKLMPSLKAPSLKDKNAAVAKAWDEASLACRAEHKPRGGFCEQLKGEGGFLQCTAMKFTEAARNLNYPAVDQIWVWRNCVMTTADLLKDGVYMSRSDLERRVSACQAKFDPEPEYPVRQSGWLGAIAEYVTAAEKESLKAVVPSDFAIQQSRVALVSCESRFSSQTSAERSAMQPAAAVTPLAQSLPSGAAQVPAPIQTLAVPESGNGSGQKMPLSKKSVPTTTTLRTSADSKAKANQESDDVRAKAARSEIGAMKSCPIPGACGPTVPAGAVSR